MCTAPEAIYDYTGFAVLLSGLRGKCQIQTACQWTSHALLHALLICPNSADHQVSKYLLCSHMVITRVYDRSTSLAKMSHGRMCITCAF